MSRTAPADLANCLSHAVSLLLRRVSRDNRAGNSGNSDPIPGAANCRFSPHVNCETTEDLPVTPLRIQLEQSDIPTHWYNVVADLPHPPAPPFGKVFPIKLAQ